MSRTSFQRDNMFRLANAKMSGQGDLWPKDGPLFSQSCRMSMHHHPSRPRDIFSDSRRGSKVHEDGGKIGVLRETLEVQLV